jgi:voltage-gated potassium channel
VFRDAMERHPDLYVGVDLATRLIWMAFAIELVVMIAVSRTKIDLVIRRWVDVAIVLFPLVSFLRVLRILRLGTLLRGGRIASTLRVYRLRGLAVRLLRAVMLLRVLERFSGKMAQRRIASLRRGIRKKQREIREMQQEMQEIETHLQRLREKAEAEEAEQEAAAEAEPVDGDEPAVVRG